MRIGIDVMGGDYAPKTAVLGVVEASQVVSTDTILVMFGCKDEIESILPNGTLPSNVEIVNTTEVIGMCDSPAQAYTKKKDSSIVVGFNHLHSGSIDAFASAGSTGAMLVGCMYTIKQIEGVIRPTIAAPIPTVVDGKDTLLLDVGLNVDCKPEVLYQYAILGSIYSNVMMGNINPRVALLNIGEEEEKGDMLTKATYVLMKDSDKFNFVGNLEANHVLEGSKADVLVCDGFIGNAVLKMAEGFYAALKDSVSDDKLNFYERLNYEAHGGTPVLGVNSVVIIGHGRSSARAISKMLLQAEKAVKGDLIQKIKEAFC